MRRIILAVLFASPLAAQSSAYRVIRTYTLGGDGSWDYVIPDPPHHRLFIARQNRLMVVDERDGKLYVNIADNNEVVEIDARKLVVSRRWPTAPCEHPVSMGIDTKHRRLFTGCRSGTMAMSDYKAGKVIATLPIGQGVDGTAYDPATGDAFASNVDGTLTVIHE